MRSNGKALDELIEVLIAEYHARNETVREWPIWKGIKYDDRHGGAFDRGSADSYYGRIRSPHEFVGDTYSSPKIVEEDMSEEAIKAYHAGYDYNEETGAKKEW